MSQPYEILIGPIEVYAAPYGTAFPVVNVAVPAPWVKFGSSDTTDAGVTIEHTQTVKEWTGLGSTGPRKVARDKEGLKISFELTDLTLEKYLFALNFGVITPLAGPPATKQVGLYQGNTVNTFSLLIRGMSPYSDSWASQYQIPLVYQSGNPKPVFKKADPAGLAMAFTAIEDPNAASVSMRFGILIAQYA